MNLYLRLLGVLFRAFRSSPIDIFHKASISLRVFPNDLDLNFHVNNGRYLTYMDLGRTDLLIRSGMMRFILKKKMMGVASSVNISFFKSLSVMEKLRLETQLLAWDEEWFYLEQKIYNQRESIVASAVIKAAFKDKRGRVAPKKIVRQFKGDIESPLWPQFLKDLTKGEQEHISQVKAANRKVT